MNTSCLKDIRKWYAAKRSAKRFRARGASEYLSYEKAITADEQQQSPTAEQQQPPEGAQEEVRLPDTHAVESSRVLTRSKSALGKRAMDAAEAAKYDKRIRRKLALEPPVSKLMSDAQKAWHAEEEEQESAAMQLSPQPGLPNIGPALEDPVSSAHSLHEDERGDESFAGGMEVVPEDTLRDTASTVHAVEEDRPPVLEPTVASQEGLAIDKSPSGSVLLPPAGDVERSPTTGIFSKPILAEDPSTLLPTNEEEPTDHGDGADDTEDDDDQGGSDEDNDNLSGDDDGLGEWNIRPPSSSDKASPYIPLPLEDPMVHEASTITPPSSQQLTLAPAQMSEPSHSEPSTTTLPPTTLLTISLASTEVADVPRSSQAGELMALQSSPSHLDVGVPSQATTPKSPAGLLLGFTSSEVSAPSPIAITSPTDVPDLLKISLDNLRGLTKKVIEIVLAGRDIFDTYKPMLTNSLNNLKLVGDIDVIQRCSEAILRLEGQIRFLEALGRTDIQGQIESTLGDIRAEKLNKYEAARYHIAEEEAEVEQLQQLHTQKQTELTLSNTSLENLREKITAAEVELTRMRAQFKREEAIVTELNLKSAATLVNYRAKAAALEEAKKELVAMLSSEDELRKQAEMLVRTDHEEKLSDIKSQIASFDLMN